ncbi:hypothetical protein ANAEL_01511 [Anaerolineales bacterium]|nr:hypothetical protein ANAEL_01511 [Anaerolineales bacterium]
MNKNFVFTIVFFIISYFMVRLPFLIDPLINEEGTHAFVFCCNPPSPKYLWIATINGEDQFDVPQHPALIYETLGLFGAPWGAIINNSRGENPLLTSFLTRFAFTLFQFSYFLLLIILLRKSENVIWRKRMIWVVIALSLAPIAIYTSISVQVDGSVGSFFPGLVALSLLARHENLLQPKWALTSLFVSSAILGFGKNEWGLALLLSVILTGIFILLARGFYQKHDGLLTDFAPLGIIIAGLIAGNLINYLYDPKNYLGGFFLIRGLSAYKSDMSTATMLTERIKFLYLNFLMVILICGGVILALRKKVETMLLLTFIWGSMLFFAYFVTHWGWLLKRYYAPSFVVITIGVIIALKYYPKRVAQYISIALIAISLIGTLFSAGSRLDRLKEYSFLFTPPATLQNQDQSLDSCVPLLNDGEVFTNGIKEFISGSVGETNGEKIANKFGKSICK